MARMAELDIEPDKLEAYCRLLSEEIEASVALEPGVLMLHAVALKDEPGKIRILEVYANQRDYEAHLQTPHFLRYKKLTAGMVRSLTLVDVAPIAMRAKPATFAAS
ncbi:putative quinol monooxygenase [Pararhizobium sp. LjRoot235]|uniref:putative quinol monooxygenase n=1 Tax=Pararhizobium sp. LjRoot235 TaxID=3342291 RepID=UPI003F50630A